MNKTIEIDGKEYTVDFERATHLGLLVPVRPLVHRHRGQHYEFGGEIYVVSVVGADNTKDGRCRVSLININHGTRFTDPIEVEDSWYLTEEEWSRIISRRNTDQFTLVKTKTSIIQ